MQSKATWLSWPIGSAIARASNVAEARRGGKIPSRALSLVAGQRCKGAARTLEYQFGSTSRSGTRLSRRRAVRFRVLVPRRRDAGATGPPPARQRRHSRLVRRRDLGRSQLAKRDRNEARRRNANSLLRIACFIGIRSLQP